MNFTNPEQMEKTGPTPEDLIPLFVILGLVIIAGLATIIFELAKRSKKSPPDSEAGNDAPPRYPGLGSVEVILGFSMPQPPSYEEAVAGEEPPMYSFDNAAFTHDPPNYCDTQSLPDLVVTV